MIKIKTEVKQNWNETRVISQVQGLSDKQLGWFAKDIVSRAQKNAARKKFKERTGALEEGIEFTRLGHSSYQVATTSGHASYIEFGTQFIQKKMAFLWTAYRAVKRRFMKRKWT